MMSNEAVTVEAEETEITFEQEFIDAFNEDEAEKSSESTKSEKLDVENSDEKTDENSEKEESQTQTKCAHAAAPPPLALVASSIAMPTSLRSCRLTSIRARTACRRETQPRAAPRETAQSGSVKGG